METAEIINTIVTALIAPVVLGGFAILWKFLEKKSNLRITELEKKVNEKGKEYKQNFGQIYNILNTLMVTLKADRCYIIQPHPLGKNHYISVVFEVDAMGIMPVKNRISNYEVDVIPMFFGDISTREFLAYNPITELKGNRARSNFIAMGTGACYIRQMNDTEYWVGNIVVDYLGDAKVAPDFARAEMATAADNIQYLLPPIQ